MSVDPRQSQKDRHKGYMEQDFQTPSGEVSISAEMRIANALEYIAFQLGQINRKMDAALINAQKLDE